MEADEYSFYRHLNQILRDEDRRRVVPWFHFLKQLDSALNKLPIVKGCVWHGVPQDVSQHYHRHEQWTWWSITSCTLSVDIVEQCFAAESVSTLFMIEVANGRDISAYTMRPYEEEVILRMGIRLSVKNNGLKNGNVRLFHLMEIDDFAHDPAAFGAMALSAKPAGKGI